MVREELKKSINKALKELKLKEIEVNLEHPEELSNGDYSTNVAMVLAKEAKQNPRDLASKISDAIKTKLPKEIKKVEVAGPGFINFYLSDEFFIEKIKEILKSKEKFGKTDLFSGQKFLIEHTQPNPFKEFHIGHLMNNAVGESISRIVRENGADTKVVGYHGDVGLHVAKTIWAMLQENRTDFKEKDLNKKIQYLGSMYARGDTAYELNESAKKQIEEINKEIYEKTDKDLNVLYDWGREASIEYLDSLYKRLGSNFDHQFYESEVGDLGKEIVEKFLKKGVFEESEGAVVFKGEKFGQHTRVFINKLGIPTYEAKEIGLAELKRNFYKYDKSLTIVANEQNSFFDVVETAIGEVFPKLKGKLSHICHGVLKLSSGKMSSRTGTIISTEKLISDTKNKVLEKITTREFNEIEKDDIAEKVAIGAIRYSILHQANGKDIIFDFDKSLSFEGDSGPYLQYSYARAKSILRKAKEENIKPEVNEKQIKGRFGGEEGNELEKILYRFPEIVERAGKEYSSHYIATYLIELASTFNGFYSKNKIVDREDLDSPYKTALTEAFSIVVKNGLNLLGIVAPERM